MGRFWWDRYDTLLLAIATMYLIACPYNKVEESFNTQAAHDILFHTLDLVSYDHHEFPGVVPRTFIGPLVLALLSLPMRLLQAALALPKWVMLYTVRWYLGLLVLVGLGHLRASIKDKFGDRAARWMALLIALQFHFLFYCTRTLPNTFALVLVLHCYAYWMADRPYKALAILAVATMVFRSELFILCGILGLWMCFVERSAGFFKAIGTGILAALVAIAASVAIDSVFWGRPLWPEGVVLYFNTVLNKSHEWGVFPPLWYFTSAMPRALLASLPLALLGVILSPQRIKALRFASPLLLYVAAYSFLPHKELRFIIYAVPLLTLLAALAMESIMQYLRRQAFLRVVVVVALGAASVACLSLLAVAAFYNYPGGVALGRLQHQLGDACHVGEHPRLHMDIHATMTGVSRFLEEPRVGPVQWSYSKLENLTAPAQYRGFTHLLHDPEDPLADDFNVCAVVEGFAGMRPNPRSLVSECLPALRRARFHSLWEKCVLSVLGVRLEPSVLILARKS
ncbi:putative asparagine-linked glycosylation 12 [Paratrimastix pyriformis]|uniref:Mannosyltransferase n=1 Tax=Paratrimastix pyriformis TaxID=342808 RepID=A0ABQ8UPK8_9EUKA|nr:putative asparagine-linked glycosylation 12 [Paratrimastix pyriformis]